MSENRSKSIWDWLGFQSGEEMLRNERAGRVLGVILQALFLLIILSALALLFAASFGLRMSDADTVRNLGLILAAVFTAGFAGWRGMILSKQADIAEQGHITDRYIKAVEQLGAEKTQKFEKETGLEIVTAERTVPNIEVRIGALYTLERIAGDSLRDHIPIMETICAYIRNNAGIHNKGYDRIDEAATKEAREEDADHPPVYLAPREDIQTALTILGRRGADRCEFEANRKRGDKEDPYRLDLRATLLAKADLSDAELALAQLDGANLRFAKLSRVDLSKAKLVRADLCSVDMKDGCLEQADFTAVKMNNARLDSTNFRGARFDVAQMKEAVFNGANLTTAWLSSADVEGAFFYHSVLDRCECRNANFTSAKLDGAKMVSTRLNETVFYKAKLQDVDFGSAYFREVDLRKANLERTDFTGAYIEDWQCEGASLLSSNLSECKGLKQKDIDQTFGVKFGKYATKLPERIAAPAHWFETVSDEVDPYKFHSLYRASLNKWIETSAVEKN